MLICNMYDELKNMKKKFAAKTNQKLTSKLVNLQPKTKNPEKNIMRWMV